MNTPEDASDDAINHLFDVMLRHRELPSGPTIEQANKPEVNDPQTSTKPPPWSVSAPTIEQANDSHDWDGTPDTDYEVTPAEAVAILDLHAAAAAKAGNYGLAADLAAIVRLIERMDK
jgi:hypothetical protein